MNHRILSIPILFACILSSCAVHTDMTHSVSPVDNDANLQEYQKVCQSMTYVPQNYTVEEDTYIYWH